MATNDDLSDRWGTMKPKIAWAVLNSTRDEEEPGQLMAYGNGAQWQLPIFYSRKEAISWKREAPFVRSGKVIRVEIRPLEGR